VTDLPQTRYARSGDAHIAYQVLGEGEIDLVFVAEWATSLEAQWEEPRVTRVLRRLASFSRLIVFDRRGVGLSDPVSPDHLPTLEQSVEDVRAVMDAAGSARAVLMGVAEGGPINVMFATTDPTRVVALVLVNSYARLARAPDYPIGIPTSIQGPLVETLGAMWGSGDTIEMLAPSMRADPAYRAWWARMERASASPGTAMAMFGHMFDTDVRAALSLVAVPTLVVHRTDDRLVRVGHGRFLADNIPSARLIELPGEDHTLATSFYDEVVDEVEEFLTGVRPVPEPDRVLATVLFTDIVSSTERVIELGDAGWRDLLDAHHAAVRTQLDRFGGHEVDTAGDGFFATFDGPARAIRCARAIRDAVRAFGLDIRSGIHTGEVEVRDESVSGIAVHVGARISSLAGPGEVLVSRTVVDLVAGSGILFEDRGEHPLKGVPGSWRLFAVED
jgi:class 3 adenylate cyclase